MHRHAPSQPPIPRLEHRPTGRSSLFSVDGRGEGRKGANMALAMVDEATTSRVDTVSPMVTLRTAEPFEPAVCVYG